MLFPSELGQEVALRVHSGFLLRRVELLAVLREDVKRRLKSEASFPDWLPVCSKRLKKFSDRLLNALLHGFVQGKNDEVLAQKQKKQNKKGEDNYAQVIKRSTLRNAMHISPQHGVDYKKVTFGLARRWATSRS